MSPSLVLKGKESVGVHPPWLAPERGKPAFTQNTSAHLEAVIVLPPPTLPKSDICHSQSAQIATHLCSAALVLQREKDWARRAQGDKVRKREMGAWKRQAKLLQVVTTLSLLTGTLETTPSVLQRKSLMHKLKRCHCFWIHLPAAKVNNSAAPGFFQHKDTIGPQLDKQVLQSFECLGSFNSVLE